MATNDGPAGAQENEARRLLSVSNTGLTNAPDETMDRLAGLVSRLLGSTVGLVSLVDDTRQFFPGQVGLVDPLSGTRQTPLEQSMCREVVATNDILQIDDAGADPIWEHHGARTVLGVQSYLGAPLLDAEGRVIGSLCALETAPRKWTADERQILVDLAFGASSELRARIAVTEANDARADAEAARAAAELARGRVELMADVSTALISTMDPETAIERMLAVVVRSFANWAIVVTRSDETSKPRIFGRHRRRDLNTAVGDLGADSAQRIMEMDLIRAVQAGEVQSVILTRDEMIAVVDQRSLTIGELVPRLGVGPVIIVPMTVAGQTIGVLAVIGHPDHAAFDPVDAMVAGDLARRAAMTFDHAMGYLRAETVAFELQHSLLPTLRVTDRLAVDVVYEAASQGVDVGGDWYDLVELPDGSFVATIGDVTGHNIHAAAAMGRVQVALRIFALAGHRPAQILELVAAAADGLLGELLATCLVVRLEPRSDGGWSLEIANAGHLPPVVLDPRGTATLIEIPANPLLGLAVASAPSPRATIHVVVEPGSMLVLCTDGLVEHRGEPLDVGLERLRAGVVVAADGDAFDGFCRRLVDVMRPSRKDDIACIALRL